jgi:tRNA pseudouridine55 synthase
MIATPAKSVADSQTADARDIKDNDFSPTDRAEARGNNDPRANKQARGNNNQPRRDKRDIHGWIVLDKPIGMTSTQAVAAVKRL